MKNMLVNYNKLSNETKREINWLQSIKNECDTNKKQDYFEALDELESAIKVFNCDQKYKIVKMCKSNVPFESLETYVLNHNVLHAKAKIACSFVSREPKYQSKFDIRYEVRRVNFSEVAKYVMGEEGFSRMLALYESVSSCIFENIKNNNFSLYKDCIDREAINPYRYNSKYIGIEKENLKEKCSSKSGIKHFFAEELEKMFETDYLIVYTKMINELIYNIINGANISKLIDCFFIKYAEIKNPSAFEQLPAHTISRHVDWCAHQSERFCTILNQPCHSSIDCVFYLSKKNGLTIDRTYRK